MALAQDTAKSPAATDAKPPAAAAATIPPAPAEFKNAAHASAWLTYYYQHPDPAGIPRAYRTLVASLRTENKPVPWAVIGILGGVMIERPELIKPWAEALADLPIDQRSALVHAAWHSRTEPGLALVRAELARAEDDAKPVLQGLLDRAAKDPVEPPLRATPHLELLWGRFFASGDERFIIKMFEALPEPPPAPPRPDGSQDFGPIVITNAVRETLAANMFQHRKVLEICKARLESQPEAIQSVLRDIIANVEDRLKVEESPDPVYRQKPAPASTPDAPK